MVPSDSTMDTVTLPIDCQGAGCSTESVFRTRGSGCFGPSPSVSNWSPATFSLSDFAAVAVAVRNASNGDTDGANNIWWCFERRALDPPSKSTSWQEDDTVIVSVSMPSETVRLDHHFNHILGVVSTQGECARINWKYYRFAMANEPTAFVVSLTVVNGQHDPSRIGAANHRQLVVGALELLGSG